MHEFGSSGVRGVTNEGLSPTFVLQVARAAGAVWEGDRAALGRDTRTSGTLFADAAASGLASVGLDCTRLGELPTPALQAHCEAESVPGVMITASHNPAPYNGVKLVGADGVELDRRTLGTVEDRLAAGEAPGVAWDAVGQTRREHAARERYVEAVVAAVDRDAIAAADLTVAIDPGHGAGCHTSPALFRELGCTVRTVNAQPDGTFPGRDPEPVPENLSDLVAYVEATDADLGIAHDGDADRATFVAGDASVVDGDAALAALVAAEVAAGDTVVSAVNVSQRVVDIVEDADATLSVTPIGSTNIITRIRDHLAAGEGVPVAGEGNGGVLFPAYRIARDGAYTAAKFLELVADRPATAVVAPFDGYENVRESVRYADEAERAAMTDAVERVAAGAVADLDTTDGYRLEYGDGWVLARPSGTEPVIRVTAEARTAGRASELANLYLDALRRATD